MDEQIKGEDTLLMFRCSARNFFLDSMDAFSEIQDTNMLLELFDSKTVEVREDN